MPRSKAQNEEIRARRRAAILAAAVPHFARNGFSQASISAIAAAAGASHGTVFRYFPTKEALFRAAVLEPLAVAEQAFAADLSAEESPLLRIEQMVRRQLATFLRSTGYLRLVHYVLGQSERFPELAGEISSFARRFCDRLAPLIAEGQRRGELGPGPPLTAAMAYFSFLNGAGLCLSLPEGESFPEEIWEGLVRSALRLFGPADSSHHPGKET
jgi:TetR/AcrR family transcriptional regulator, mexJK operon transcriptional repressor